jgi:hypothetical protein
VIGDVIECLCNGMCISRDMTRIRVALFGPIYIDLFRPSESPDGSNRNKKYALLATDILILFFYIYAFLPSIFLIRLQLKSAPLILLLYHLPS